MPKITELRNQHMVGLRGQVPHEEDGVLSLVEQYQLRFTDRQSGDVIWLGFDGEAKDTLVAQLAGIQIATQMDGI